MRAKLHGTELYFDIDGAGLDAHGNPRPTLVALHGGPGFDHGYLRGGLDPLRDDAQLLYVDLRGQGRSAPIDLDTFSLEQMADDVDALCELLGIDAPLVFGHSAGGFVALHLALRHPRRVRGLILCDSSATHAPQDDGIPGPTLQTRATPEAAAIAARFFGGDLSDPSVAAFTEHVMPLYAAPGHLEIPMQLLSRSRLDTRIVQHYFANHAGRYDLRPRLGDIAVPALVIYGEHDWVCPPRASRALARGIPGATLVEIADAGHFAFAEEPARFLAAVRAWLPRS